MKFGKTHETVEDDQKPLLHPTLETGQVAVAADEARLHEQASEAFVPERRWEGHLLQCCGSCDSTGWLSCLFSRYLPCVAFGTNAKRGFRSSAWKHGLLFLVLFGLAYWVWVVLGAAGHNVLASCNGPLPHPPHPHPHRSGHPSHSHPVDIWGPEGLLGRFLHWDEVDDHHHWHPLKEGGDWQPLFDEDDGHHSWHSHPHKHKDDDDDEDKDKDIFVSWGTFENSNAKHHDDEELDESDGSDGDHHHKHTEKKGKHKNKEDKPKKTEKDKKGDRKILPGATLDLDLVKPEQSEAAATAFTSATTFEARPDEQRILYEPQLDSHGLPLRKAGPQRGPEAYQATPECRQAMGIYFGVWLALIASVLVAVHYAARRRTLLRMKFGIAGSRLCDFCTWFWCGSCALCQETRTLWVNQVEEGVWKGPAKLGYTAVPTLPPATNQPPSAQFMTTGV